MIDILIEIPDGWAQHLVFLLSFYHLVSALCLQNFPRHSYGPESRRPRISSHGSATHPETGYMSRHPKPGDTVSRGSQLNDSVGSLKPLRYTSDPCHDELVPLTSGRSRCHPQTIIKTGITQDNIIQFNMI